MMAPGIAIACALGGYFAGSVSPGWLLARRRGIDLQSTGSGNIGATNVARTLGAKLGMLVLFLDAMKGFIPALAAGELFGEEALCLAGGGAFLGHLFPIWLRFRGGKGVATALGVLAIAAPNLALFGVGGFATGFAVTRTSSIGSLVAALAVVIAAFAFELSAPRRALVLGIVALVLVKHIPNIRRMIAGREGRL